MKLSRLPRQSSHRRTLAPPDRQTGIDRPELPERSVQIEQINVARHRRAEVISSGTFQPGPPRLAATCARA